MSAGEGQRRVAFQRRVAAYLVGGGQTPGATQRCLNPGFSERIGNSRRTRLFFYEDLKGEPLESRHAVITPYLFDGGALANPHLTIREEREPINGMRKLIIGTQPLEDGQLTFSSDAKAAFIGREPDSAAYFRPFPGCPSRIRGQAATGSGTKARQWETERTLFSSARATHVAAGEGQQRVVLQRRVAAYLVVGGQTPGATQRCLNPGFSERIENSRRTRSQVYVAACCPANDTPNHSTYLRSVVA